MTPVIEARAVIVLVLIVGALSGYNAQDGEDINDAPSKDPDARAALPAAVKSDDVQDGVDDEAARLIDPIFNPVKTVAVINPFGCGHNYYFVRNAKTWYDAEKYCISTYAGHLVKVDSQYEHNFLVSVIASSSALNTSNYWIGGHALSPPTNWHWSCDNSAFVSYGATPHVAPWGFIQPDGDGACAHMWLQFPVPVPWSWNDVNCLWTSVWGRPLFFICEKCGRLNC